MFELGIFLIAIVAGGVASVTGFGIGSFLTPVFAVSLGTKLAVAVVAVPHFVATALRLWIMRAHVDRKVLLSFGLMSAAGGLLGALLHSRFSTPALAMAFGEVLMLAGFLEFTGLSAKLRLRGAAAWVAGAVSGFFGGLVGNQGGIRSAGLLGFDVSKEAFVATATAVGVMVDLARLPVYLWTEPQAIAGNFPWILTATLGAVAGTLLGLKLLRGLPKEGFRKVVAVTIFILGAMTLYQNY